MQHGSELAPASIEHGLCHPCLCQAASVHIVNEDSPMLFDQPGTELVQRVHTPICNLGVYCFDALLLAHTQERAVLVFQAQAQGACGA